MNKIKITDIKEEIIEIGKQLFKEKQSIYTEKMCKTIMDTVNANMPNSTQEEKQDMFYRSVYDYWVYGNNIAEEFYYHFYKKTHEEKSTYITFRSRYNYINHLNKRDNILLLADKYKTYQFLKPYFKREVIQISSAEDYGVFKDFISRHPIFVAKPAGLGLAIGVHKVDSSKYDDKKALFEEILAEGTATNSFYNTNFSNAVVIEEIIAQHSELARIHPQSVNGIRVTTVRLGDKVNICYPWFKIGVDCHFVTGGAQGSMLAGINAVTGIVDTVGFKENGEQFRKHPQTDIEIMGYKIPQWDSLIKTATEIAKLMPEIGYVGWDLVLTPDKGWCVMEGNFYGEFIWQLVYNRGMKKEIEDMIDWKPEEKFWWEK